MKNELEEMNTMRKLKIVLAEQNTKLREARDILLPKLMNGQIEVWTVIKLIIGLIWL